MLPLGSVAGLLCVGMIVARFAYVGDTRFRFCGLLWNLFLAAIPLGLAMLVRRISWRRTCVRGWSAFAAWLLFFPNAFYLITDLSHVRRFGTDGVYPWYDLLMTACFAAAGVFLGSLSLYLVHGAVQRWRGRLAGWFFAVGTLALGSFGVFLGRFLRFNSWDVLLHPLELARSVLDLAAPLHFTRVVTFCGAFFAFSLVVYCLAVAAARLHLAPARLRTAKPIVTQ